MESFELERRWQYGGDRSQSPYYRINVPYRYYTFYFTCANVVTIALNAFISSKIYHKRERLRKTFFGRLFLRAVNTPIWLQIVLWTLISLIIDLYPYYRDVYVVHLPSYIHFKLFVSIWKRSGGVSYALLPFVLLLSLKPSPLPKVLYTKLLPLHRWCTRIYIVLMGFHSVMFMQDWVSTGDFWSEFFEFDMLTGIISFFLWLIVLIVSIKPIRVRIYKSFYALHMIATWTTVPLVYFHASPEINFFNYLNLIFLAFMVIFKLYFSVTNKNLEYFQVERQINSQLYVISLPKDYYKEGLTYYPGSHLRINYRLINPLSWLLPSHPYTIASLDSDESLKLIIKETNFKISPFNRYNFSKPFSELESGFFDTDFNNYNITIVCGGSGIAFGLPLYRYFVDISKDKVEDLFVHFIWIVRNAYDLHILVNFGIISIENGEYTKSSEYENFDIYITSRQPLAIEPTPEVKTGITQKLLRVLKLKSIFGTDETGYIEMSNYDEASAQDTLLEGSQEDSQEESVSYKFADFIHEIGRPDLSAILNEDFQTNSAIGDKCLIACGPQAMLDDCSRLAELNKAEFLTESYNF